MTTGAAVPQGAQPVRPTRVGRAAVAEGHGSVGVNVPDIVDVWGADSFPASDPPANW